METIKKSIESVGEKSQTLLTTGFNNIIIVGLIAVFLGVYGPRLHPKLPPTIRNLFNNNIFRFAVILVILYITSRNLQLSIVIAIVFLLVISLTNSLEVEEKFMEKMRENYSNYDILTEEGFIDSNVNDFYRENFANPEKVTPEQVVNLCKDVKYGDDLYEFCSKHRLLENQLEVDSNDMLKVPEKETPEPEMKMEEPEIEGYANYKKLESYENYLQDVVKQYTFNLNE